MEGVVTSSVRPGGEPDFRTGIQIPDLLKRQANGGKNREVTTHNREISRGVDRMIELSSGKAAINELLW